MTLVFRMIFAFLLTLNGSFQLNVRDERLSGTTWYVTFIAGTSQPINPLQFKIDFDLRPSSTPGLPHMITGRMICNYLFADYSSPITGSLNITDWTTTTAACFPESDLNREREFATNMKLIATYQVESGPGHRTLTFYDASKFVVLRFITLNQAYLPIVTR
ncbi:MAG: META domain-containing protein [Anaerolineae bacterium]|nr:META domain-containing protein [Anaerolineae bacterium]